jgi:hypothetical protein
VVGDPVRARIELREGQPASGVRVDERLEARVQVRTLRQKQADVVLHSAVLPGRFWHRAERFLAR